MMGMKMKKNGKKMAGMKKKMGKGGTAKAKSRSMNMAGAKKAKKSKSMYA